MIFFPQQFHLKYRNKPTLNHITSLNKERFSENIPVSNDTKLKFFFYVNYFRVRRGKMLLNFHIFTQICIEYFIILFICFVYLQPLFDTPKIELTLTNTDNVKEDESMKIIEPDNSLGEAFETVTLATDYW